MIRGFEDLKQEQSKMESKPKTPWSTEVLVKSAGAHRGYTESPLKLWYLAEDAKRRVGVKNEIDIADIQAAAGGVKNRWSDRYKKNSDLFRAVMENRDFDWEAIQHVEEVQGNVG